MTYALVLMFCIADAGRCLAVNDAWNPLGYATMAACEARRMELTLVIRATVRPVHMVSRCELLGRAV